MADKKEYTAEEVKVLLDINTSLVNITSAINTMKSTMDDLVEMEKKHGMDLQLFNERMKFMQGLYNTLNEVVTDIKDKINMLTTQLDYQERKELRTAVIKKREKEKEKEQPKEQTDKKEPAKKFDLLHFVTKKFSWIVILICVIATLIILFVGGKDSFKTVADFYTNLMGGGR